MIMDLEQSTFRPSVALYLCAIEAGEGLDKQYDLLKQYAAQRDWTVAKVYQDAAVSLFTPVWERPVGRLLLEAAVSGEFQKVLVPNMDTIAADTWEAANFHKQLAACGVSLHSIPATSGKGT